MTSQVGKVGFHPSGAAPLGTPGLPPLFLRLKSRRLRQTGGLKFFVYRIENASCYFTHSF
jgi:hypothetical protein